MGSFIGFELQSCGAFDLFAKAFQEGYKIPLEHLGFFTIHVEADEDHIAAIGGLLNRWVKTDKE